MGCDKLDYDSIHAMKRYVTWLRNSIDDLMEKQGNRAHVVELKRYLAEALRCLADKDVMKKYLEHLKTMTLKAKRASRRQRKGN